MPPESPNQPAAPTKEHLGVAALAANQDKGGGVRWIDGFPTHIRAAAG